ncbi:MAG: sigma-70 family RNA polymerase sigma factor [Actinomycetota bacterium]
MDEESGFDMLYRRTGPLLWRAVLAYTGGRREVTDDVVAEAFARTMARGDAVRAPERYLYRVAFRLAAQELRRTPTVASPPDLAATPADDGLGELLDAVRQLSPGQRAAVYLRYQGDLPVAQIADLMGTSSATVRVHLLRGRRRLASLIPGDDDD